MCVGYVQESKRFFWQKYPAIATQFELAWDYSETKLRNLDASLICAGRIAQSSGPVEKRRPGLVFRPELRVASSGSDPVYMVRPQ